MRLPRLTANPSSALLVLPVVAGVGALLYFGLREPEKKAKSTTPEPPLLGGFVDDGRAYDFTLHGLRSSSLMPAISIARAAARTSGGSGGPSGRTWTNDDSPDPSTYGGWDRGRPNQGGGKKKLTPREIFLCMITGACSGPQGAGTVR